MGKAVIVPACHALRRNATPAVATVPTSAAKQKMPGNDIHGGFASHIVVPVKGLCPVDETRWRRPA